MPQIVVTAKTGTPVPLMTVPTYARNIVMRAVQNIDGLNPSANSGVVAIGHSPTANQQPLPFNPGDERLWNPTTGLGIDLGKWYLAGTTGDGLVITWE